MENQPLKPERITKPIQLLGAWLAGLLSIDSCFLFAAASLGEGSWEAKALVIASIVNVPIFLFAVFLLQTRFRPELQEDSYYSTYLSNKTNELVTVSKLDMQFTDLRQQIAELGNALDEDAATDEETNSIELKVPDLTFGVNMHLQDSGDIERRLRDNAVTAITTFGSNSPPPGRNVSISEYLSKEDARRVIQLARELGFATYNFFDNYAEEAEEDVLFGSYGKAGFKL